MRGFRSEVSIQQKNLNYHRNGPNQNQISHIESLCKAFDLSAATNFSPFNSKKEKERKESDPSLTPEKQQPCKKCAKIRDNVKKFFRAKFEMESSGAEQPIRIRMKILKDEANEAIAMETHPPNNASVCFGCDSPKRESSTRGPPLISPVCTGNISACPLGDAFQDRKEGSKKIVKIDRPRSLGPRKRMVDKERNKETSIYEGRKLGAR